MQHHLLGQTSSTPGKGPNRQSCLHTGGIKSPRWLCITFWKICGFIQQVIDLDSTTCYMSWNQDTHHQPRRPLVHRLSQAGTTRKRSIWGLHQRMYQLWAWHLIDEQAGPPTPTWPSLPTALTKLAVTETCNPRFSRQRLLCATMQGRTWSPIWPRWTGGFMRRLWLSLCTMLQIWARQCLYQV